MDCFVALRASRNDDPSWSRLPADMPKPLFMSDQAALQEWQIADIEQALREADAGDFASDEEVAVMFKTWRGAVKRRKRELS